MKRLETWCADKSECKRKLDEERELAMRDYPMDLLVSEATKMAAELGRCTTSMLQRRMNLNYAKAVHLMDLLEEGGIISAPDKHGGREVLVEVIEDKPARF